MTNDYELDRLRADNVQLTHALKRLVDALERNQNHSGPLAVAKQTLLNLNPKEQNR